MQPLDKTGELEEIGGRLYGRMRLRLRQGSVGGSGLLVVWTKNGVRVAYEVCIDRGGYRL
jgi:hypothetical protein